jgi:hypothetical protein
MIPIALDCETDLIRPGVQAPDLACVAVWGGGLSGLFGRSDWIAIVHWLLTQPNILIVGHGVAYDMIVLGRECPELLPLIFDAYEADRIVCTEIRQKLLDIASGFRKFHEDEDDEGNTWNRKSTYNLEDLALRILHRKLDKDSWRLRYGELKHVPIDQWPEGARTYPLEDDRATLDIWQYQEQWPHLLLDQFRQSRAAFWIKLMAAWGIHTDAQGVFELAERTGRDYEKVAAELRGEHLPGLCEVCGQNATRIERCPRGIDVPLLRPDRTVKRRATGVVETESGSRNTKAAATRLIRAYQAQGKDYPLTKKGKPCLNEQACIDSHDIYLVQYSKMTSLKNVLVKDVPALQSGVLTPIHSYFDPLKETGRTSSARPNIQNVNKLPGIRECFVPRCFGCGKPHDARDVEADQCIRCGHELSVFVASDFGGLELSTLAQACITILGHSRLAQALNAGWDPHLMIASQILGADYELLKGIRKGTIKNGPFTQEQVDNARQTGKVANFGFPGGLGAESLVAYALMGYGVRLTIKQAKELKRIWLATWPEMSDYFRYIDAQTSVPFPLIEQLFAKRYRGKVNYTAACNTLFQGLGSDIAKDAGWHICKACYVGQGPLFGCRICNFVHDEFVLEALKRRVHAAGQEQARIMKERAAVWLPDVTITVETTAMYRYSKKAKPTFVDDRLVPWAA